MPSIIALTLSQAPASAQESGGQRAAQAARLGRCLSGLCAPPAWLARELEHALYARVAAGAGDRQRKKQRCGWGSGRVRVWCAKVRISVRRRRQAAQELAYIHTSYLLVDWLAG